MSRPLNPALYDALRQIFGEVRISREGEPFRAAVRTDPLDAKKVVIVGDDRGENYEVCCPQCGDRRFRLSVSHRLNTRMNGRLMTHLFQCFNEHCETNPAFSRRFIEQLKPYVRRSNPALVTTTVSAVSKPAEMTPVSLPDSTALHHLPDHPVCAYLRSRGQDPEEMGQLLDVRWAERCYELPELNRLIFPVYVSSPAGPVCYGYQARFFDEQTGRYKPDRSAVPREVKWYTMPGLRTGKRLYNGMQAAGSPIVVVTEGPLDVARVGPSHAVATFGKNLTSSHLRLLWKHWGKVGAAVVLAYDADAWIVTKKNEREVAKLNQTLVSLKETWAGAVRLRFAKGQDPGSTPRLSFWKKVALEMDRAGILDKFEPVLPYVGTR